MGGTRKGVGAYLSLKLRVREVGACQIFLPSGWALIRGGHLFEVGAYLNNTVGTYLTALPGLNFITL